MTSTDEQDRLERKRQQDRERQRRQRERDALMLDILKLKVPKGRSQEIREVVTAYLAGMSPAAPATDPDRVTQLEEEVSSLRARVAELEEANASLKTIGVAVLQARDAPPPTKRRKPSGEPFKVEPRPQGVVVDVMEEIAEERPPRSDEQNAEILRTLAEYREMMPLKTAGKRKKSSSRS